MNAAQPLQPAVIRPFPARKGDGPLVPHLAAPPRQQYLELKATVHRKLLNRLNLERLTRVKREDAEPEVDLRLRGDACRAGALLRPRAHYSEATDADVRSPAAGSTSFAAAAPPSSPMERPARTKYHAPMSVIGMKLRP